VPTTHVTVLTLCTVARSGGWRCECNAGANAVRLGFVCAYAWHECSHTCLSVCVLYACTKLTGHTAPHSRQTRAQCRSRWRCWRTALVWVRACVWQCVCVYVDVPAHAQLAALCGKLGKLRRQVRVRVL
jgi:hypothetical protein